MVSSAREAIAKANRRASKLSAKISAKNIEENHEHKHDDAEISQSSSSRAPPPPEDPRPQGLKRIGTDTFNHVKRRISVHMNGRKKKDADHKDGDDDDDKEDDTSSSSQTENSEDEDSATTVNTSSSSSSSSSSSEDTANDVVGVVLNNSVNCDPDFGDDADRYACFRFSFFTSNLPKRTVVVFSFDENSATTANSSSSSSASSSSSSEDTANDAIGAKVLLAGQSLRQDSGGIRHRKVFCRIIFKKGLCWFSASTKSRQPQRTALRRHGRHCLYLRVIPWFTK